MFLLYIFLSLQGLVVLWDNGFSIILLKCSNCTAIFVRHVNEPSLKQPQLFVAKEVTLDGNTYPEEKLPPFIT